MADKSKIEWTDATWNPIRGIKGRWHCMKVSEGCKNCYAERLNLRFGGPEYRVGADKLRVDQEILSWPLKWKKPRMVFVCSMTDLFLETVPDEWIYAVFKIMASAPQHIFQVLTKRAERMAELVPQIRTKLPDRLEHVWLGVSVENQNAANKRIPQLQRTLAAVHWLSCEPLLGPVDIYGAARHIEQQAPQFSWWKDMSIDWVVVGGESGTGHRPMELDWARSIIDQCRMAGTPVFVKQLGGWPDKRGDPEQWPEDLRVREWPRGGRNDEG
jgi:protein gp37